MLFWHSYYFLYAENKSDESEKITFTHDGEVSKIDDYFSFSSSFIKVYTDQQLILHFDLDDQSRITVQKYDNTERLNLVFSIAKENTHSTSPLNSISTLNE